MNVSYQLSDYSKKEVELYNSQNYIRLISLGDIKGFYYKLYLSDNNYDYNQLLSLFIHPIIMEMEMNKLYKGLEMIELLFMKGANPNYEFIYDVDDEISYTSILIEIFSNYVITLNNPLVQLFMKYGANLLHEIENKDTDEIKYKYKSIIKTAIDYEHFDLLEYLIKNRFNKKHKIDDMYSITNYLIDSISENYETLIDDYQHIEDKYIDIIKLLIQYNFSMNDVEDHIVSLYKIDGFNIIRLLMKNSISLNKKNLGETIIRKIQKLDNIYHKRYECDLIKEFIQYNLYIPQTILNEITKEKDYLLYKVRRYYEFYDKINKIRIQSLSKKYINRMKTHYHLMHEITFLPRGFGHQSFPGGEEYRIVEESFYSIN